MSLGEEETRREEYSIFNFFPIFLYFRAPLLYNFMVYAIILVISGRTEVIEFTQICSISEPKFEENH